jgi:hypothetical protein
MPLTVLSAGCVRTVTANDVPPCEELIPASLLARTPPADPPESAKLADGHDDARPWQRGFVAQTGQLEKADDKKDGVVHIVTTCLVQHRKALKKSNRGFVGRLLSAAEVERALQGRSPAYRAAFAQRLAAYRRDFRSAAQDGGQAAGLAD